MLDERKSRVLKAVIEAYTDSAAPVGSGSIGSLDDFKVSSATIRNDMAALESEGYLRQPHTSAGRVPTQKGYRYFVDQLDTAELSSGRDHRRVSDFFAAMRGELEEILSDTASLLTRLTDHTAVVVEGSDSPPEVRSIQVVDLHERVVMLVVVLASGQVVKHTIETAADLGQALLEESQRQLSDLLVGHRFGEVDGGDLDGSKRLSSLSAQILANLYDGADSERMYVDGASHIADAFEAVESVSRVLSILEQQLVVVSLLADVTSDGVTVSIGNETGVEPLNECSLVVSPFEIAGEYAGTVALLGPTRMKYPEAMSAVAAVSNQLSEKLGEG